MQKRPENPTAPGVETELDSHGVFRISWRNPGRHNALNPALLEALDAAVAQADSESDARVLLLSGLDGSFCAGFDLDALAGNTESGAAEAGLRVAALMRRIRKHRLPVIAAAEGAAFGAGGELLASADLRVVAGNLRLGMPPVRIGLIYDPEGLQRFRALVGDAGVRELFLGGAEWDAETALLRGLVQRVVPAGAEEAGMAWAREIAGFAPLAVQGTKVVLGMLEAVGEVPASMADEVRRLRLQAAVSADHAEAMAARRERRAARFRGR